MGAITRPLLDSWLPHPEPVARAHSVYSFPFGTGMAMRGGSVQFRSSICLAFHHRPRELTASVIRSERPVGPPSCRRSWRFQRPVPAGRPVRASDPRAPQGLDTRLTREVDASACEQTRERQSLAGMLVGKNNRCLLSALRTPDRRHSEPGSGSWQGQSQGQSWGQPLGV